MTELNWLLFGKFELNCLYVFTSGFNLPVAYDRVKNAMMTTTSDVKLQNLDFVIFVKKHLSGSSHSDYFLLPQFSHFFSSDVTNSTCN